MDLSTTDARAIALAPQIEVTLLGRDFAVWTNPGSGSTCRLESTGDYEVSRLVRGVPKPIVLGQVSEAEAATMLAEPNGATTLRAVAQSIVAVDATAR